MTCVDTGAYRFQLAHGWMCQVHQSGRWRVSERPDTWTSLAVLGYRSRRRCRHCVLHCRLHQVITQVTDAYNVIMHAVFLASLLLLSSSRPTAHLCSLVNLWVTAADYQKILLLSDLHPPPGPGHRSETRTTLLGTLEVGHSCRSTPDTDRLQDVKCASVALNSYIGPGNTRAATAVDVGPRPTCCRAYAYIWTRLRSPQQMCRNYT